MKSAACDVVSFFLEKEILISPDIIKEPNFKDLINRYNQIIEKIKSDDFLILGKEIYYLLDNPAEIDINWQDLEKSKAMLERGADNGSYGRFIDYLSKEQPAPQQEKAVKIVSSYDGQPKKRGIQDFVFYFNARFKAIESILRNRQELQNITTINRILNKKERENVSIAALISSKHLTKNGNIMLSVEDPTGTVNVLISKNKPDLFSMANSLVLDEVIGISGVSGENIIFANNVIQPDIPTNKTLKKHSEEIYAIFLSDIHVGSNNFLSDDFNKFISWIRGEVGSDKQKDLAKKVKYIFIAGDLVDGCGIYPGQDKELVIKDVYKQYEACANLLQQIPKDINIIISPGNHDALRIAEPQPRFYQDFSEPFYRLENATLVSNPAMVNVCSSKTFSGFDVLLYHGYSFDYFVANVESLRNRGGYDRADLIMKFLLKRRHLAPSHTSTLYLPEVDVDPLVITKIPDFFVTGHVHKSIVANYRGVTLICGSCWQSKTSFQERVGHNPQPSRVPLVNLKTRDVKILRFGG
ncbi:MAG: DNA-directed DNA polymerase II small subunit [Nanoarchaeota archaeon]